MLGTQQTSDSFDNLDDHESYSPMLTNFHFLRKLTSVWNKGSAVWETGFLINSDLSDVYFYRYSLDLLFTSMIL